MAGMGAVANALLNLTPTAPAMDLVGPTVDDDVRRLVSRYGSKAVKAAVARHTKAKAGRKKLPDWKELQPLIDEEARIWLEGGDPFAERSNYSIAKAFADANPGQSHPATMRRITRKLGSKKFGRRWYVLVTAWYASEAEYSYLARIRTLEALAKVDHQPQMWRWHLKETKGVVDDYTALHGKSPPNDLTMEQVTDGSKPKNALSAFLGDIAQPVAYLA